MDFNIQNKCCIQLSKNLGAMCIVEITKIFRKSVAIMYLLLGLYVYLLP